MIELLVVVAIIGLLASIVLASLDSARRKGRDARRAADVRGIQQALSLYNAKNGQYPNALSGLVTDNDISSVPTDPRSGAPYAYAAYGSGATCNNGYHLAALLEVQASYVGAARAASGGSNLCTGGSYAGTAGNGLDTLSASLGDFNGGVTLTNGSYVYDVTP